MGSSTLRLRSLICRNAAERLRAAGHIPLMKYIQSLLFSSVALFAFTAAAEDSPVGKLPELPQPATSFGATVCDGWLYVYGGNTGKAHEFHRDCVKGDFFRLKMPDGQAWETLTGGAALLSPSLVAYQGKVIRIGGLNARNAKGEENDLHSTDEVTEFDPATGKWTPLPSLPEARSSHDAAILGDTLYVAGGWRLSGAGGDGSDAVWYKSLLSLDLKSPTSGWQSVSQPFERRAIATVAINDRLWFIGGMGSDEEPSLAVDWFELATGTWGKGPDLPKGPMAGFGAAACISGGRILASPLSGQILALDADGTKWEEVGELNPARFFHRLLPLEDGRLVAVGGSNRKSQIPTLELVVLGAKSETAAVTPAAAGEKKKMN